MEIIPSVLVQTEEEFLTQINAVKDVLSMIQLDIADGKFVPNTTWADPTVVLEKAPIDIELHLMVNDPLSELKKWTVVEKVKRVLIHFESVSDLKETITKAKKMRDWQVGVVLNPDTDPSVIEPHLTSLDAVMFMGVYPGFQGQSLVREVLTAMSSFIQKHPDVFTEIDGAVNEETLKDIQTTGVQAICPGSAVFKRDYSPKEAVEKLKDIINS